MSIITADQWQEIRVERETTGVSFRVLSDKYGVSDAAICKRSQKEGWSDGSDVAEVVRRKVSEKVSGIVSGVNPQKKAEAIDAEAEKCAAVAKRLREEVNAVRDLFYAVIRDLKEAKDIEIILLRIKAIKLIAEVMEAVQRMDRKNWNLDIQPNAVSVEVRHNLRVTDQKAADL